MRYVREVYRRQVEEMCLPLHSVEMTFFSSRELCHPIKPDDCYWSIGHNYNRALVAASIGSYGAYLADGSKYRLALLLVVLILAHELEVVEDTECKFI
ncbi:homocysteine S-methyltransferase 1-like [Cucumis melo var. makuwa]|uniref:Homocysteine S-methyltransferase 1-like n=1 Tax=Cucumis melo var. makuwa TaxID=1194695 RepID=A0A5D3DYS5_CUCMM|nr:homocysteine S-methyltransferase 1-like [Cucumis melo var. makuwa]